MSETLKYLSIPVEKVTFENVDDRISKLVFKLMHSALNNNKSDITIEAIKNAINDDNKTIVGMPILAFFNKDKTDVMAHDPEEQVIGFIPQINNNLFLEKDDDSDKTYVYVDGYIYNHYSKNIIDIFRKAKIKNQKGCSVEIEVLDGHKDKSRNIYVITSFKYLGVTILGDSYKTGMVGTTATLTYNCQEDYCERLNELNNYFMEYLQRKAEKKVEFIKKDDIGKSAAVKIDLSKESASDKDWGNVDKTKLRNDILAAKNYKACVNACYLVVEDGYIDAPSEKLRYPVCEITSGKLVLSTKGCEAALSFLEKNTKESYYASAKAKLKRYYKRLGLSTENFSEDIYKTCKEGEELMKFNKEEFAQKFSITSVQLAQELDKMCKGYEMITDSWGYKLCRYSMRDYDDSYIYAADYKDIRLVRIPYEMNKDTPMCKFENLERVKYVYEPWEVGTDGEDGDEDDMVAKEKEDVKEKMSLKLSIEEKDKSIKAYELDASRLNSEIANAKEDYVKLSKKYIAIEQKLGTSEKDMGELKSKIEVYECEKLNKEKLEKKQEIQRIFDENAFLLNEEDIKTFSEKLETYEDFNMLKNELKSLLFDRAKEKENLINNDISITYSYANVPSDDNNQIINRWALYSKEYNK